MSQESWNRAAVSPASTRIRKTIIGIGTGVVALSLIQGPGGPLNSLGGTPTFEIAACVTLIAVLAGRFSSSEVLRVRLTHLAFVGLLILFVLGNMVGDASLRQWQTFLIYVIPFALCALASAADRMAPLIGLIAACAVQVVLALGLGPYIPTLSGVPQLSGGLQPNILGLVAAIVAVTGVALVVGASRKTRILGALLTLTGLVCVLLSVSRTGLLALIVGVVSVLVVRFRTRLILALAAGILLVLLAASIFPTPLATVEAWFVRGDVASLASLTGRTEIWKLALDYFSEKPFLGWGFGGLYSSGNSAGSFLTQVRGTNTHNALLQYLVEGGIFAAILMVALAVTLLVRATRMTTGRPLTVGLVALLMFNAVGSASFATVGIAAVLAAALFSATRPIDFIPLPLSSPRNRTVKSIGEK